MGERVRHELDMRPEEVLARLRANTVDATDKRAMFRAMLSSGPWMSAKIDGRSFLPQLRGEKGNPQQWIYCWYSKDGNRAKAKVFARNRRYKLYGNGDLFDVNSDVLEKHPLPDDKLDEEAAAARSILQNALDQYSSARPEGLR